MESKGKESGQEGNGYGKAAVANVQDAIPIRLRAACEIRARARADRSGMARWLVEGIQNRRNGIQKERIVPASDGVWKH